MRRTAFWLLVLVAGFSGLHGSAPPRRWCRSRRRRSSCPSRRSSSGSRRRWSTSTPRASSSSRARPSFPIRSSAASSATRISGRRASASSARSARASFVDPSGIIVTNNHVVANADRDQGGACPTGASSTARSCSRTSAPTSRCCASTARDGTFPTLEFADSDQRRGGRPGARHRRSLRRRPDGDERHRLGARPHAGRRLRLPVLHPDRCGHQSGQFGRRADRHDGRLVGINTAIFSRIGRIERHRLRHSLEHGARRGRRRPRTAAACALPWIGASFQAVTPEIAEGLGLKDAARRAGRRRRHRAAPAPRRGLKTGDLITSIDGVAIDDPSGPQLSAGDQGHRRHRQARHPPRGQGLCRYAGARGGAGDGAARRDRRSAAVAAGRRRLCSTSPRRSPRNSAYQGSRRASSSAPSPTDRSPRRRACRRGDVIVEVNGTSHRHDQAPGRGAATRRASGSSPIERNGRLLRQQYRG